MLLFKANAMTWELDPIPSLLKAMFPAIIHSLTHQSFPFLLGSFLVVYKYAVVVPNLKPSLFIPV